ncbi:MAG: alcohol dehydrogenase catalytic domain-containing protein [Dehalococcoidia bacterium]
MVRQLVFGGVGRCFVESIDEAALGPGQVRIRPLAAGICGSDVHGFSGENDRRSPGQVMGHEFVGEVVESADDGAAWKGRIVTVNPVTGCGECQLCLEGGPNLCQKRQIIGCAIQLPGAFAEEVIVPAENVVPFEGSVPSELGALVEPLSVGTHAAGVSGLSSTSSVAVLGGGPVGLGAALAAHRRAAEDLVVSEPDGHRREIVAALGLVAVPPDDDALEPGGFDVVIDCVGAASTVGQACQLVKPAGTVVVPGLGQATVPLPMAAVVMGERIVRGSAVYRPDEFRETADWVASGEIDLEPLIEDRIGLDALPAAFTAYADGSRTAFKTLYCPA